jgi:hypothetical protein
MFAGNASIGFLVCFRLFGFEPPEPMGGAQTN